jgi:micrococcal nuclease
MHIFLKSKYFRFVVIFLVVTLIFAFVFYRLEFFYEDFKDEIDIPVITDENSVHFTEAPDNIGKKLWVKGKINHVFVSNKGNYFLNFCPDFRECPFSGLIFADKAYLFNDINSWSGKSVYIYGLIETYQNRPQVIIENPQQIVVDTVKKINKIDKDFSVNKKLVKVINVIDGDTVWVSLEGVVEPVRLIGIDAPEIKRLNIEEQCYGKESYEYLKNTLKDGLVVLEAGSISSDRDKYNRLLRYVYLSDGTLLNSHLLEKGYAFVYLFEDFEEKENFLILEKKAKEKRVGLWGENCGYYTER